MLYVYMPCTMVVILTNQISPYEVDKSLIKPCIYVQGLITTSRHTSRTVLLLCNCIVIVLCVFTMVRLKVNCHKWAE